MKHANGALSGLVIQENEPVGTIGTFQCEDPDGDALTYSLVSGVGDGNNSMFTLESNGTLKSAVSFDYEAYTSLSIRASVSDGVNAGVEGNFTVATDVYEAAPNSAGRIKFRREFGHAREQKGGNCGGTFQAQDPDGDPLTYSLVSGVR